MVVDLVFGGLKLAAGISCNLRIGNGENCSVFRGENCVPPGVMVLAVLPVSSFSGESDLPFFKFEIDSNCLAGVMKGKLSLIDAARDLCGDADLLSGGTRVSLDEIDLLSIAVVVVPPTDTDLAAP